MKAVLVMLLLPFARLLRGLQGARQLWAFSSLQAGLRQILDRSVVVLGCPELQGTRNIRLGRNLFFYRDVYLETRQDGAIVLGDDVVLSRGVHLVAFDGIQIGAGSMIGEYASIRDANHKFGAGLVLRESGHSARPIVIGRNVWIGRGVTILPGVRIGDDAVIGANAVVTRDVAAASVAAGVPARSICHGVTA
jgi:acetyltransferase-like isoleucine patch superfamily enzyme